MRFADDTAAGPAAGTCAADGARLFPTIVGPRCPICGTAGSPS